MCSVATRVGMPMCSSWHWVHSFGGCQKASTSSVCGGSIILDEAHEQDVKTQVALSLLKMGLAERPYKLIWLSIALLGDSVTNYVRPYSTHTFACADGQFSLARYDRTAPKNTMVDVAAAVIQNIFHLLQRGGSIAAFCQARRKAPRAKQMRKLCQRMRR